MRGVPEGESVIGVEATWVIEPDGVYTRYVVEQDKPFMGDEEWFRVRHSLARGR